ncbi:pentatricopeptide repeat-containing protein [Cocos nucifera]|uniref:Pentatricopeptide repeat-containing protein n=1 Tax=Cocos nucifera TaxID=13894 RepID=A0A8K0IAD8_COCNU|nr:pentatricopeptide repeat-containing protein [Cocos nucifera]
MLELLTLGKRIQILNSSLFPIKFLNFRSLTICSLQSIDVSSLNKLIMCFSKAGDLVSARRLFDQMTERDIVSWNSIMTAYAENGCCDEVVRIFSEMNDSRLMRNHTSISTVLSACAKLRALELGKQIHGLSIKTGSSVNVFVGTSLVTMYSKCNVSDCLFWVFDDIVHPNLATWNALISGFAINCRISYAREVFDRMPRRNVVSWTAMINGYIKVKKVRIALELFDLMPAKNAVTWSVMLGGFVSDGQLEEAIEFFAKMMNDGVPATAASIIKVANACSGMKNVKQGRKIHCYAIKFGFHLDQSIEASLVLMYCECLNIEAAKLEFDKLEGKFIGSWNSLLCGYINNKNVNEARKFFDLMDKKDEISWNSMINGYLKHKRTDAALELFSEMPEPTVESATALMSSFLENGNLNEAQKLFNKMLEKDVMAYTTLIHGYMEEGLVDKALQLFNKMPERNVVTYNVMISGLLQNRKVAKAYKLFNESPERDGTTWDALISGIVQNGLYNEAFPLFKRMLLSEISPSELAIASLLTASSRLSLLILGEQIHAILIKLGHESHVVIGNSLINMYCKCGDMLLAKLIFDCMPEWDVVTWNAVINGYAFNGLGKNAIEMFEIMKRTDTKPNEVTFLGILSACTHMCLLDEAQHYISSMKYDYGISPTLMHYACIIDLLCRMGMVEKAEKLAYSMPFEPDSVIWTSLLSGCRLNCNIKLAENAANQLFACDARDPMPYLHLISVYGSAGRWDDMEKLRTQKKILGSDKQPGCSWI